jgi:cephalosporin hydroxylase
MYSDSATDAKDAYKPEKWERISKLSTDNEFLELSRQWRTIALCCKYISNFSWLGGPMRKLLNDAVAMQELLCSRRILRKSLLVGPGK